MIQQLVDAIVFRLWWPIQLALICVALAAVFLLAVRIFGWARVQPWLVKLALPVGILLAAVGVRQSSLQAGYSKRSDEESAATEAVKDDFEAIHRRNEGLSDDQLDKKNQPWLRG